MTRPTVRRATYSNDCWAIGAEVARPMRRWAVNAAVIVAVLALIGVCVFEAVILMGSVPHLYL